MPKKVEPEKLEDVLTRLELPLDEFTRQVGMIADGMKVFAKSQLKYSTILLLISRSSGVGQRDVERVLEALGSLDKKYLKSKP